MKEKIDKMARRAGHLKRLEVPAEQRLDVIEAAVKRLSDRLGARVTVQTITPFLLTCYIEGQEQTFAYVPIKCKISHFDIAVDEIRVTNPNEKPEASVTLKAALLNGAVYSYQLDVKKGHFEKPIDLKIDDPAKITISFNKPVFAWICIIAYPLLPKREVIKEEG